jgi:hypothetical protein
MNAAQPGVAEHALNFTHSDVTVPIGFSEALRVANSSPACRMPSGHPRPPRGRSIRGSSSTYVGVANIRRPDDEYGESKYGGLPVGHAPSLLHYGTRYFGKAAQPVCGSAALATACREQQS